MSAPKPEWAGEYGTDYSDIVRSWGFEVKRFETLGSYQGDIAVILRDGERAGWITIGYGSCSGCDHLQAITPWGDDEDDDWTEVIAFRESLQAGVHWEDSEEALASWLLGKTEEPDGNDWSFYDDEVKDVAREFITAVSA